MRRISFGLIAAIVVAALPSLLAAAEGKRPEGPPPGMQRQGPNPETMLKRLDANRDGVITRDELPADMPERIKFLLKRADANQDGKVELAELKKAIQPRPEGRQAKAIEAQRGKQARPVPPKPDKAKSALAKPTRPQAKKAAAPGGPKTPEKAARTIFNRLDKNQDGQLNFNEFYTGLRHLRQAVSARVGQWQQPMKNIGPKFVQRHFPKGFQSQGPKANWQRPHHGKNPHAMSIMLHGKDKFAGCPYCFHCMKARMGQMQHRGPHMQYGMKPGPRPGPQMHRGMKPGPHPGMQFGMSPWQKPMRQPAWGQGHPGAKKYAMKPEGKKQELQKIECPKAQKPGNKDKKPELKKSEFKKPAPTQSKEKVQSDRKILEIEARLTAVENQQKAILAAIQEQQATMMAALQKTNRLVVAKLASMGSGEGKKARPQRDELKAEQKSKELAKKPQERKPQRDRD